MSITVLTGLPGSGKSERLIEAVNAASAQGRPTFTFACSDSQWIRRRMLETGGMLESRRPGLACPLDYFVSTDECASILSDLTPGALVAFEEAHAFEPDIVPHWVEASHRNLDVLIALPSDLQRQLLATTPHTKTLLAMACERCHETEASTFMLLPNQKETLSLCVTCDRELTALARQDMFELLSQPAPPLGEKQLYQPIELEEYPDWTIVRPDSNRRAELVTWVLRDGNILPGSGAIGRLTYLDVGCNTGYFCHHLTQLGFHAEGIDAAEREIKVAKLLDSFIRRDFSVYTHIDAYRYLEETSDHLVDVTSAFSVFSG